MARSQMGRFGPSVPMNIFASVVSAAEILLQPDVGADEEVSAAHLFDLELGHAVFAILP